MEAALPFPAMCSTIIRIMLKRVVSIFSRLHTILHVILVLGANTQNAVCMGALQSSGDGGSAFFGQAFMMAQFLVLNVGDTTISFAEIAQDL